MSVYPSAPHLHWGAPQGPALVLICLNVPSTPIGTPKPTTRLNHSKQSELLHHSLWCRFAWLWSFLWGLLFKHGQFCSGVPSLAVFTNPGVTGWLSFHARSSLPFLVLPQSKPLCLWATRLSNLGLNFLILKCVNNPNSDILWESDVKVIYQVLYHT